MLNMLRIKTSYEKKKMADTRGKIAVLVDGNYSALRALSFPLPALAAMQEAGVQIGQGCWDSQLLGYL